MQVLRVRKEITREQVRRIACVGLPDAFRLFANAKEYQHGKKPFASLRSDARGRAWRLASARKLYDTRTSRKCVEASAIVAARSQHRDAVGTDRTQSDRRVAVPPQPLALDNGLKPGEISEIITHLAFYSGWANATSAVGVTKAIFDQRGVKADQIPAATGKILPLDEAAEAKRASAVQQNFGTVAPGVVQFTTDVLFRDLWLRPGLAPRDRSLVTVSALVATGQVAQITYHLNRAMDNGLTRDEASEVMTQLAFYAGWPNVFSALPVVKDVFEKRAH